MTEVRNQTPFTVEVVPQIDAAGHNVAVAIAKATYELAGRELVVAAEQSPLAYADEFDGDPADAPLALPSDVLFAKPGADVVVPPPAGFHGRRHWRVRTVGVQVGQLRRRARIWRSWSLGPQRRDSKARRKLAGTYDKRWLEERMPLLPVDFDLRHNQVAAKGLVSKRPFAGDETIVLENLWQRGRVRFTLPGRTVLFAVNAMFSYKTHVPALDTLVIDPLRPRITLIWRYPIRCRQKFEEVRVVTAYDVRLQTARQIFGGP